MKHRPNVLSTSAVISSDRRRVRLMAGAALAMALPGAALAETAAAPAENVVSEVIVTAFKRETNLQKTPVSISVVGAQALKDRHVQSLYDLADGAVPSLRVATFEARQSALTVGIRGIVPLDANQPAREQGVGIYVDGVYLGRQHGLNAALFDLERIEVLKGPQGTLFGRNTEGGALSIVSKAPSGRFEGRAVAGVSNLSGYNGEVHVDFPTFANVSVKADGIVQYQGPSIKNPMPGQKGWGYFDRNGFRLAARWKPFANFTADFAYDKGEDKNTPFYSQLLNYNPNNCPSGGTNTAPIAAALVPAACSTPGTNFSLGVSGTIKPLMPGVVVNGSSRMKVADIGVPQQPSVDKTDGFSANLKWRISPALELRSITAWRSVNATQWDNSGGAHRVPVVAPGCTGSACNFSRYSLADLDQTQFSQEFQAVGSLSRIDYVAGLYYFREHVSDDAATPNSNAIQGYTTAGQTGGYTFVTLDPCTGSAGFGSNYGCRSIDRASEVWSKSYAAFGQATWNVTDQWHLTLGGRYTKDKKRGVLHFSRNINYDVDTVRATANGYKPLDKSWSRFNPLAILAYDFSADLHGYVKYATGYRAGGASSRTSDYRAFNPEDVKSYEAGLKSELFDRRLRLNVAAYHMDRTGSQVDLSTIQPTATGNFNNLVTFNAPGKTKIDGLEVDAVFQIMEGLTFTGGYAYTKTDIPAVPVTYQAYNSSGVAVGAPTTVAQKFYVVFTPRNAFTTALDYSVPFGGNDMRLKLHLDTSYAQATQAFDQFATKNDSSFIVNGRISLADIPLSSGQRFTVSAWARNLLDEQYVFRRDPSNSIPAVQVNAASAGTPPTPIDVVRIGNVGNILGDYGNFNAPRTFGVEVSLKF